jgi:threonyl-tRNA synthetase
MPTLKLPDGSVRQVPEGARPRDVAAAIGKRLAQAAVAAKVNDVVVDLDRELPPGDGELAFQVLTDRDPEALAVLRHSCAHIMARAVMRLFPGAQLAFGPALENGFYYDIDSPAPIREEDFPRIEEEMRKIVADAEPFERFERSTSEARELVRDLGQEYKVEHIDDDLKQVSDPELLSPGRIHRPLPRPAHSQRRQGRRVQAPQHRRRLLEERRQPPAAPAPLRHCLFQPEGPRRLSASA